jgi:hypothetical protein
MTYLELVNAVLRRVREAEVSTVQQTPYSKLIGDYVNETKREVEDAWDWNALRTTLTANTTASVFNYVLVGSGYRFRVLDVLNDTSNWFVRPASNSYMNEQFLLGSSIQTGSPTYYSFNGQDANGDTQVDLFPVPDAVYAVRFNVVLPQPDLSNDSDILSIPSDPVIQGAVLKAIIERGEDGGRGSELQAEAYRKSVGNAVAIEANRFADEITWNLV